MHKYRTNTCNELRKEDVGKSVKLSGFIRTIRDLGSVMFVDLTVVYLLDILENNKSIEVSFCGSPAM